VHGFARTIARTEGLEEPTSRYIAMIETASVQMADLLDELGLVARIEAGRYEPTATQVELGELVRAATGRLDPELVRVEGEGAAVSVDAAATERALAALVRCALRHGGLERVDVRHVMRVQRSAEAERDDDGQERRHHERDAVAEQASPGQLPGAGSGDGEVPAR